MYSFIPVEEQTGDVWTTHCLLSPGPSDRLILQKLIFSGEISPTRCNSCVFILRNGFTLHVSGDNLTHHPEYICCIWPQVSRLT
jgi:hypothetical protein